MPARATDRRRRRPAERSDHADDADLTTRDRHPRSADDARDGRRDHGLPGPRFRAQRGAGRGARSALTLDTFTVANTVPNIIYILLAGGVLNAVFVPQVVRAMKNGPTSGRAYTDRLLTLAGLVLLASPWSPLRCAPAHRALHRRQLRRDGRRRRDGVRVLVPAADLLLRRLHDARAGPQRPRQLRADDVGAGRQQHGRHRGRRWCSSPSSPSTGSTPRRSSTGAIALLGAGHHARRRAAGAGPGAGAAPKRASAGGRAGTSAASGWAGPATWPSGPCCSCWSTSWPTS